MQIEEYGWDEARTRLDAEWQALIERGDLHPSLEPEWIEAIAVALGRLDAMRVLAGRENGCVVGIMPVELRLEHTGGIPIRVLGVASNLCCYHQEIVAPGHELAFLRACLRDPARTWDRFDVAAVDDGGRTAAALEQVAIDPGAGLLRLPGDESPYLPIDVGWDDFLAARSRNFRYNLRRKERTLAAAGAIEERWYTQPDDVAALHECMLEIEANSWKVEADMSISEHPHEQAYYRRLLPYLAARGYLQANVLFVDGHPAAYHLCYFARGRMGNLKTSFHERFRTASPGAVVVAHAVRHAFDLGATEFDFLGDTQRHKREWTDETRRQVTFHVYSCRPRARVVLGLKRAIRRARRLRAAK